MIVRQPHGSVTHKVANSGNDDVDEDLTTTFHGTEDAPAATTDGSGLVNTVTAIGRRLLYGLSDNSDNLERVDESSDDDDDVYSSVDDDKRLTTTHQRSLAIPSRFDFLRQIIQ